MTSLIFAASTLAHECLVDCAHLERYIEHAKGKHRGNPKWQLRFDGATGALLWSLALADACGRDNTKDSDRRHSVAASLHDSAKHVLYDRSQPESLEIQAGLWKCHNDHRSSIFALFHQQVASDDSRRALRGRVRSDSSHLITGYPVVISFPPEEDPVPPSTELHFHIVTTHTTPINVIDPAELLVQALMNLRTSEFGTTSSSLAAENRDVDTLLLLRPLLKVALNETKVQGIIVSKLGALKKYQFYKGVKEHLNHDEEQSLLNWMVLTQGILHNRLNLLPKPGTQSDGVEKLIKTVSLRLSTFEYFTDLLRNIDTSVAHSLSAHAQLTPRRLAIYPDLASRW